MDEYLNSVEPEWFQRRIARGMVLVTVVFSMLVGRLFYLQIIEGERYRRLSENNRVRVQDISPLRGRIFDRSGMLLADNRPSFNLMIVPRDAAPLSETLAALYRHAGIPEADVRARIDAAGRRSFRPLLIKRDIGRDLLAVLESHGYELPGIYIDVASRRQYVGKCAPHLIGYLGEINTGELSRFNAGAREYHSGEMVGKCGIEKSEEAILRGRNGLRQVEVNARGQVVREIFRKPAVSGADIYLALDIHTQKRAEALLRGKVGALVALDPASGDVLAMASAPSFDPELFIRGMSSVEWRRLADDPDRPIRNKVIQGTYPPASTYKIVTGMAGLEERVINPDTGFFCPGYLRFGNRNFRCWRRGGHGRVKMESALEMSCDVFFYQVGIRLGVDALARYAAGCGFGTPTGIRIPGEAAGLVPTTEWKKRRLKESWHGGETLPVAIGQGYNLVTPLQVAVLAAALAADGVRYRPRVIDRVVFPDGKKEVVPAVSPGRLPAGSETLRIVKNGLWRVVNGRRGTARASRKEGIRIWGKTGTAQVVGRKSSGWKTEVPEHHKPHAWFTAWGEKGGYQIAVAVLVEHGESGSSGAAPLAADLAADYLHRRTADQRGGQDTSSMTVSAVGETVDD